MNGDVFRCGARTRRCRACGHRYSQAEHSLWECPECGEARACKRAVTREGGRCRLHGGASLSGMAAPSFRDGRYSKYLPAQLKERYADARADETLLSLRDEVALLDTRLMDIVSKLDTGEGLDLWVELKAIYQAILSANEADDPEGTVQSLARMGKILEQGAAQERVWAKIVPLLDQRRKLVESERKRLVELQQVITVEKAMVLVSALVNAVSRRVQNRAILSAISADFGHILSLPDPVQAQASADRDR